jgi:hypothetical protein
MLRPTSGWHRAGRTQDSGLSCAHVNFVEVCVAKVNYPTSVIFRDRSPISANSTGGFVEPASIPRDWLQQMTSAA